MTGNGYANRIAHLCAQFKLPTVGAEAVNRFTRAGHGDALSSLLEVLEMEAEDRKQRRVNARIKSTHP